MGVCDINQDTARVILLNRNSTISTVMLDSFEPKKADKAEYVLFPNYRDSNYFIVENSHTKAELGKTTYGIGVEMYTQLPNERTAKERKVVDSVFVNRNEAEKFVDIICRGCVTPVTLEDVIYDYISEDVLL